MAWYIQSSSLLTRSEYLVAEAQELAKQAEPKPTDVTALFQEIDECRFLSIDASTWHERLTQTIKASNQKEDAEKVKQNLNLAQRILKPLRRSDNCGYSYNAVLNKIENVFCGHYLGEKSEVDVLRTYSILLNSSCESSSSSSSSSSISSSRPPSPWPISSPPPTPPPSSPTLNPLLLDVPASPWPNMLPLPSPKTSLLTSPSSTSTYVSSTFSSFSSLLSSRSPTTSFVTTSTSTSTTTSSCPRVTTSSSSSMLTQLPAEDLPFPSKPPTTSTAASPVPPTIYPYSSASLFSETNSPSSTASSSPLEANLFETDLPKEEEDPSSSSSSTIVVATIASEPSSPLPELEETFTNSSSTIVVATVASQPASPEPQVSKASSSSHLFSDPVVPDHTELSSPEPESAMMPTLLKQNGIPRSKSFPDILNPSLHSNVSTPDAEPPLPKTAVLPRPLSPTQVVSGLENIFSNSGSGFNFQWGSDIIFPSLHYDISLEDTQFVLEAELEIQSTFLEPTAIAISKIAAFFDGREASDIAIDVNEYLFSLATDVRNSVYESILIKSHRSSDDLEWAYKHIADDRTLLLNILLEEHPYIPVPFDTEDHLSFPQMQDALFAILAADKTTDVQSEEINTLLERTSETTRHAIYEEIFEKSSDASKESSIEWIQEHIADNWTILWNALIAKMPITVSAATDDEEIFEEDSRSLINYVLTWVSQILNNEKLDRRSASMRLRSLLKGISRDMYDRICMELLQKQQTSKSDIDLRWVESHLSSNRSLLVNALINHVPCTYTQVF